MEDLYYLNNDVFGYILSYLEIDDIVMLEKVDKRFREKIFKSDFIFKRYSKKNYPKIVDNKKIFLSWYELCKKLKKNTWHCLCCGEYMGIGPITSLLSYYKDNDTLCLPGFHINCVQLYLKNPGRRRIRNRRGTLDTYTCPLTEELVVGFNRLNV